MVTIASMAKIANAKIDFLFVDFILKDFKILFEPNS